MFLLLSHNFARHVFSFGVAGGGILNDAAIINDILAYEVSAIYLNDSTTGQQYPNQYNLIKLMAGSGNVKNFDQLFMEAVHQ